MALPPTDVRRTSRLPSPELRREDLSQPVEHARVVIAVEHELLSPACRPQEDPVAFPAPALRAPMERQRRRARSGLKAGWQLPHAARATRSRQAKIRGVARKDAGARQLTSTAWDVEQLGGHVQHIAGA